MPRFLRARRDPAPAPTRRDREWPFRSSGNRAVVLTIARDEAVMLPRWVAHYGGMVGMQNLVVFDDNSTDGSTDSLPCTVHRLPPLDSDRVPFEMARMRVVSGAASGLLAWYDVAVFTDVDEFLVPDPARHESFTAYLDARADRDVIAPLALNVVHTPGEPPLDPGRPVLGQRRYAKFMPLMCKPSVKRVPARWMTASHGIDARYRVDPELFMLHLKFADRDHLRRTSELRRDLVEADGRASGSSWKRGGDKMIAVLDEAVAGTDLAGVAEFDPAAVDLEALVVPDEVGFRTRRQGQVQGMRGQPLVRVPARLEGLV